MEIDDAGADFIGKLEGRYGLIFLPGETESDHAEHKELCRDFCYLDPTVLRRSFITDAIQPGPF